MGNLLVSSNYKIDFTAGIFNILTGKLEISDLNDLIEECSVSSLEAPVAKDGFGNEIVGVTDFELPFTQEGQYDIVWEFKSENHKTLQVIHLLIIEDNRTPVPDQQSLEEIIVECSISNIQPPTATDSCYHIASPGNGDISFHAEAMKFLDDQFNLPTNSAIGGIFSSFTDDPDVQELILIG